MIFSDRNVAAGGTSAAGPPTSDEAQRITAGERFHVLTAGYDFQLIESLWQPIQAKAGFVMSHLLHPIVDERELARHPSARNCFCIRRDVRMRLPPGDRAYLASLEQPDVPTVHNMILCDEILRQLNYDDALSYATYLARRMEQLFAQIKPSLIVSGFDAFHSSMALAVARKLGIPWYAISHSTIPTGLIAFCPTMHTGDAIGFPEKSAMELRTEAERILDDFEARHLAAPFYVWENNFIVIIRRFPNRLAAFIRSVFRKMIGRFDKFTRPPLRRSAYDYIRRKLNLLLLPKSDLISDPPDTPYAFIGLHKEPEMALDVWAPFYSDQLNVIAAIARSLPPTHQLLVKLHKLDADNYSRRELNQFRKLPGVRLVSPFASSRAFIERAALVFCIQGTITQEAAMCAKQVLVFGKTAYEAFPNVLRVERLADLPLHVREKLSVTAPTREAILLGLVAYLSRFAPGCHNNWDVPPSDLEIAQMATQFEALQRSLQVSTASVV